MRNKNSITLATTACVLAALIFTHTAFADTSDTLQTPEAVDTAMSKYVAQLKTSYLKDSASSLKDSKLSFGDAESSLAEKMATEGTSTLTKDHLSVTSASVGSGPLSSTRTGQNYTVTTEITTKLKLKADKGTKVYIGNTEKDTLDSSWTDKHVITLTPAGGTSSQPTYNVTSDVVKDDYASVKPLPNDIEPALPTPSSTNEDPNGAPRVEGEMSNLQSQASAQSNTLGKGWGWLDEINYADKWTSAPYAGDAKSDFNPSFPYYDDNCTNFESQAMYAGGLPLVGASSPFLYDTSVWTWNLSGILSASRTWSYAPSNYTFMKDHSNTFTVMDNIWHAWQSSLLYVDWTSDGTIDHVMIVVGVLVSDSGTVDPIIDQKTNNRYQITLHQSIAYAAQAGHKNLTWYGLQYKF